MGLDNELIHLSFSENRSVYNNITVYYKLLHTTLQS